MSVGIKETKEALVGVNELAVLLVLRLKDGAGFDDIMAIWEKLGNDQEFKQKLSDAVKGISEVPAEVKDIDLNEGIDLARLQLDYLPKYIDALKKSE